MAAMLGKFGLVFLAGALVLYLVWTGVMYLVYLGTGVYFG